MFERMHSRSSCTAALKPAGNVAVNDAAATQSRQIQAAKLQGNAPLFAHPVPTCSLPPHIMCWMACWHSGHLGCRRVRHHCSRHARLQGRGAKGGEGDVQPRRLAAGGRRRWRAARAAAVSMLCVSATLMQPILPELVATGAALDGGRLVGRAAEADDAAVLLRIHI